MISVLVVDDQRAFRRLARAALDGADGFRVIAEAENGREAVKMADEVEPDVILMDVQMPEMDGIEATRAILKRRPDARVVLVSMSGDREYASIADEIGAVAFIAKSKLTAGALLRALNARGPL